MDFPRYFSYVPFMSHSTLSRHTLTIPPFIPYRQYCTLYCIPLLTLRISSKEVRCCIHSKYHLYLLLIYLLISPRTPNIAAVAVQGRKLRVATICSGAESPLLALDLIQQSMLDVLGKLNTYPPARSSLSSRLISKGTSRRPSSSDICELGEDKAYVSIQWSKAPNSGFYSVPVPQNDGVWVLSKRTRRCRPSHCWHLLRGLLYLVQRKQDIDANGESGRTFRGMMS